MFKKVFTLTDVTSLAGLVATMPRVLLTVAAIGVAVGACSAVLGIGDYQDRGTDGGMDATETGADGTVSGDAGAEASTDGAVNADSESGADSAPPPVHTVGKLCASDAECRVGGSSSSCSKGAFSDGDLLGSPVCIQPSCTQGNAGTIADLLCDGTAGLCLPTGGSDTMGICLPFCSFTSTVIEDGCLGGNGCNYRYAHTDPTTKKASGLGFCFAACYSDADCKGTVGQKCQSEDGTCVNPDKLVTYTATGTGCTRPSGASASTCNCAFVGNFANGTVSANADQGFCTHACGTGSIGDTTCNAAKAGWKCTAKLPTLSDAGAPLFNAQPVGIFGTCAQPCTTDAQCTALATASSLSGLVKCRPFADGSYCTPTPD